MNLLYGAKKSMLTYIERRQTCQNEAAKQLLTIMHEKQTNLSIAADMNTTQSLLSLADTIGPEICVLKTHIDIINDFAIDLIEQLAILAKKHQFLIFEDRKFADIGNTVKQQYRDGIYHIADWAHLTNAHILPGPGIITALREVGLAKQRGLLLLAQMSSQGNLTDEQYAKQALAMANEQRDFVMGFITQQRISNAPYFINFSPGINLQNDADNLGQQYVTPHQAIVANGTDVIIVGRGITQAIDPLAAAKTYRQAGWQAYLERIAD